MSTSPVITESLSPIQSALYEKTVSLLEDYGIDSFTDTIEVVLNGNPDMTVSDFYTAFTELATATCTNILVRHGIIIDDTATPTLDLLYTLCLGLYNINQTPDKDTFSYTLDSAVEDDVLSLCMLIEEHLDDDVYSGIKLASFIDTVDPTLLEELTRLSEDSADITSLDDLVQRNKVLAQTRTIILKYFSSSVLLKPFIENGGAYGIAFYTLWLHFKDDLYLLIDNNDIDIAVKELIVIASASSCSTETLHDTLLTLINTEFADEATVDKLLLNLRRLYSF